MDHPLMLDSGCVNVAINKKEKPESHPTDPLPSGLIRKVSVFGFSPWICLLLGASHHANTWRDCFAALAMTAEPGPIFFDRAFLYEGELGSL